MLLSKFKIIPTPPTGRVTSGVQVSSLTNRKCAAGDKVSAGCLIRLGVATQQHNPLPSVR